MSVCEATLAQARSLLLAQRLHFACQYLTEDEAFRFLIANRLNSARAAEALARRAKFKAKYNKSPIVAESLCKFLVDCFPMHWMECEDTAHIVLKITFQQPLDVANGEEEAVSEQEVRNFVHYVGEAMAKRSDSRQFRRIKVEFVRQDMSKDEDEGGRMVAATDKFVETLLRATSKHLMEQHPERISSISLINFPATHHAIILHRAKRYFSQLEFNFVEQAPGGEEEKHSLYAYAVEEAAADSAAIDLEQNFALDAEIKSLQTLLQSSVRRANDAEHFHLRESARLRERWAMGPQPDLSSPLRQQLASESAENDMLKRAVAFAKNFIEMEEEERAAFQSEMEDTIAGKQAENLRLVERLKATFGNDAPELLKH